ncbi:MAG: translocation/assembly module TamB domain-containing protein, partial [Deltaproteobacteria bacterium]|nr:translocation/assembly module TamB domain-containing protein [Deltaproteobacteria bacterium]
KSMIDLGDINLIARGDVAKLSGIISLHVGRGNIDSPNIHTGIDDVAVEAAMSNGRIDPLVARVRLPSVQANLSGSVTDITGTPSLRASAEGTVSLRELGRSLCLAPAMTGQVAVHLQIAGSLDNPEGHLRLDYGGGTILKTPVDRINLETWLADRLVSVNALTIHVAEGTVKGEGSIDLRQSFPKGFRSPERNPEAVAYALSLEGTGIHLDTLIRDGRRRSGIVNPSLSIRGTGVSLHDMTAHATLAVNGTGVGTGSPAIPVDLEVRGDAALRQGTAEVRQFTIRAGRTEADVHGSWNILSNSIRGELSLIAPDLAAILPPFGSNDISGAMEVTASVSGSTKHPVAALDVQGDRLWYRNVTLGSMKLKARLDESGTLTLFPGTVHSGSSTVRITGTSRLYGPEAGRPWRASPFTLNIEGDDVHLEDFIHDTATGTVSLRGHLEGTVKESGGMVKLQGRDLHLYGQKIAGITMSATVDGGVLRLDSLEVFVTPTESILGRGWLSREKEYELEFMSRGISLHTIEAVRKQEIADGLAAFHISGHGSLDNPSLSGSIGIANVTVRGKVIDDVKLTGTLRDHVIRLSGRLNFDLDGSFDLTNDNFSLKARFNRADLSPYLKAGGLGKIGGHLTGTVHAAGNARSLKTINADVNIASIDMLYEEQKFLFGRDVAISLANGVMTIPETTIMLPPEGRITIGGQGTFGDSGTFRAEGTLPLTVAGRFIEEISDITGTATMAIRLDGPIDRPRVKADLEFDSVGFTVPLLLQKLHDLKGRARIDANTIILDGIAGSLDTGSFTLEGTVILHRRIEPERMSLAFSAASLPIRVPDTLDMLLSSRLWIEGTREQSTAKGEIVILEGTYYRDVRLSPLQGVSERKRETAPPEGDTAIPFVKNMALDIVIDRRNPFIINNNLATMTVNPDLRIVGTVSRPLIRGRATVESGTVTYQGTSFIVKKGIIDFIDPYKIDPRIEVMSTATVREWIVFLEIAGTREQLDFKLTSDPPEEHGDILSLLLLGKTTGELIRKEGGTTQSTEQMLAGLIASTFGKDIKEATGLDIVKVETAPGNNEAPLDRIKVTLGKDLSERTTIQYSVESKEGEVVQRAVAEYKLFEHFLARGFQDTRGVYGGELQFRIEFR